jgi:hypothetical protein
MVDISSGSVIVHSMMKRNEKIKEAVQMVVCLAIMAGIGVLLAWRG